jgi:cytoskeletal protein CcmA (bactofilin family)
MIFDGKLDGEIISEGVLTLGKNAVIKGDVRSKTVIIHGTVNGNVTVQERCELKSNAELLSSEISRPCASSSKKAQTFIEAAAR